MGFKAMVNSRLVAVGAGATALALIAGGVGYAAGEITSNDIRDNTIKSNDIRDDTLKLKDINDGYDKMMAGDVVSPVRPEPPSTPARPGRSSTAT